MIHTTDVSRSDFSRGLFSALLACTCWLLLSPTLSADTAPVSRVASPKQADITLFLAGDVLPGRGITRRLQQGRTNFQRFASQMRGADIAFCNLEGAPFTANTHNKPYFAPENLHYLQAAGFDVVSLANNHALDAGVAGLTTTLRTLDTLHIGTVGAQTTDGPYKAWQTICHGQKVAFIAATTWPPFESGTARVRKAQIGSLCKQVHALTHQGVWVIVSLHWGLEGRHATLPSQREFAHQLIDAGAMIIVGHHPHVVGEMESYKGHPIFYSLGNFLWDRMPTPQSGLAVAVTLSRTNPPHVTYRTIRVVPDEDFRPPNTPLSPLKTTLNLPPTPQGEYVRQTVSGHFLNATQMQWAVWTQLANGQHCLRLWERTTSGWHTIATGSPFDLRRIAVGDIDGDGRDELVTQLFQPSKLESESRLRLHIYSADTRRDWVPKWRGSHLSRPFLDWGLLPRDMGKGCDLVARELNTQPDMGEVEWLTVYRWSGFGLRVLWQIAVSGKIADLRYRRDDRGPFVTFQRVIGKTSKSFRLRPTQNNKGEYMLHEVSE